jgi:orotate phosphoribosyltransferase
MLLPKEKADELIVQLYQEKFLQTLWNTDDPRKREKGWYLISGQWAPWYFNMRPIGDAPELFVEICDLMSDLVISNKPDLLIGIEMAGVPLVGGIISALKYRHNVYQRMGYTRPLNPKPRNPQEAAKFLRDNRELFSYGQKEVVEARFRSGDKTAILDDMSTNLGSKLIARLKVLVAAELKNIPISCEDIFYFLNRNKSSLKLAEEYADVEADLYPGKLNVHYLIEFNDSMPALIQVMKSEEFDCISDFQANPQKYMNEAAQKRVLALAA